MAPGSRSLKHRPPDPFLPSLCLSPNRDCPSRSQNNLSALEEAKRLKCVAKMTVVSKMDRTGMHPVLFDKRPPLVVCAVVFRSLPHKKGSPPRSAAAGRQWPRRVPLVVHERRRVPIASPDDISRLLAQPFLGRTIEPRGRMSLENGTFWVYAGVHVSIHAFDILGGVYSTEVARCEAAAANPSRAPASSRFSCLLAYIARSAVSTRLASVQWFAGSYVASPTL